MCNITFPEMASELRIQGGIGGGWLLGLADSLRTNMIVQLSVCSLSREVKNYKEVLIDGITHCVIPSSEDIKSIIAKMKSYILSGCFDVIHIFGSEYSTSYAMTCACNEIGILDRTILHIQGLVSVYALHFTLGVSPLWKYLRMPIDFIRGSSIQQQQRDFVRRGEYEVKTIQLLRHIGGRTDWDRACCYHINPNAEYHYYNETLRPSFYHDTWKIENCRRNSIFVSQGSYPIKGLHYLLEALPLILRHYPDTQLYVAGHDTSRSGRSRTNKLKRTSYGQYLSFLIKKHHLGNHVTFNGPLSEQQMCVQFQKSHVFVSASTIENSPNSLGEAMIIGMPCVASFVGGVSNMLRDKEEGFLYQADAPYMLAHYVLEVFSDDGLARRVGENARQHALKTHDRNANCERLIGIYQELHAKAETSRITG